MKEAAKPAWVAPRRRPRNRISSRRISLAVAPSLRNGVPRAFDVACERSRKLLH
jgi:hypothetical protein